MDELLMDTEWKSTGARRLDVRVLRAMASDLHAWRATVLRSRAFECEELLARIDEAIAAITSEQVQILIDRVAPANWSVAADASATR